MQLAGVRPKLHNRLHLRVLRKTWELKRRARESALQAVMASLGKEPSTAVSALQDYIEAEHPFITYKNAKWDSFAKDFMEGSWNIANAIRSYVASVKSGEFPGLEHSF